MSKLHDRFLLVFHEEDHSGLQRSRNSPEAFWWRWKGARGGSPQGGGLAGFPSAPGAGADVQRGESIWHRGPLGKCLLNE